MNNKAVAKQLVALASTLVEGGVDPLEDPKKITEHHRLADVHKWQELPEQLRLEAPDAEHGDHMADLVEAFIKAADDLNEAVYG